MKKLLAILLVCVMVLSLCACGEKPTGNDENKDPIVIGVLGAMSGSSASLGKAQQQGADLAAAQINAAGGILGREVKIVYRDDEADATKCLTAAQELVERERINFLVGTTNSTPAAAIMGYLSENKVVSVTCVATNDTIIDAAKYPYAFRIMPPNGMQAEALSIVAANRGYQKVALVGDTSALGTDGIAAMQKYCELNGVTPAAIITYDADASDMSPVANQLAEAGCDCGLFWALGADAAKIVKAVERIGYTDKLDIYGYTGMVMANFKELAGEGASKCSSLSIGAWAVENADARPTGRYLELYNQIIDAYGAYGAGGRDTNPTTVASAYDCVMLLKWAMEKSGSADPDAVKAYIEAHGGEYESYFAASPMEFSATDHDGYIASDMVPVKIGDMANNDLYILN